MTALNTANGEHAATTPQTITVTTTPSTDRVGGLFDQYAAAGFHKEHDGAGQMISSPDKQGHQENLALLSTPITEAYCPCEAAHLRLLDAIKIHHHPNARM